jgi:hypothetical protein
MGQINFESLTWVDNGFTKYAILCLFQKWPHSIMVCAHFLHPPPLVFLFFEDPLCASKWCIILLSPQIKFWKNAAPIFVVSQFVLPPEKKTHTKQGDSINMGGGGEGIFDIVSSCWKRLFLSDKHMAPPCPSIVRLGVCLRYVLTDNTPVLFYRASNGRF